MSPHRTSRYSGQRRSGGLFAFLGAVAAGAGMGAFVGLLYLWQFYGPANLFLAGLVGGAVAGAMVGTFAHFVDRPSGLALTVVSTGGGALGGAAWWAITGAGPSLWVAAGVGAGIVLVLLLAAKLGLSI